MEEIITKNETIEEILDKCKDDLGNDYLSYRGHIYRIFHFFISLIKDRNSDITQKAAIASAFHDIGIWTDRTFDYIGPSVRRVKDYLTSYNKNEWQEEIALMIAMHHKIRPYRGKFEETVELFRRSDLIDLSLGLVRYGIPQSYIKQLKVTFPNNGFHRRLFSLTINNFIHHPFNPLPMYRL